MEKRSKKNKTRNPELTKAKILEAATIEFSDKGLDGARVDAIAKKSDCNVNLIYHYFNNKKELFIAVMEATYLAIRTHHNDIYLRALPPQEAMSTLVRSTYRMFTANVHIIGLLSSENLNEARHIRQSAQIEDLYDPLLAFIRKTLENGVNSGVFRDGVDPIELFISINAQCYFHLSNRHTLSFILHCDLTSADSLAKREEHVVDIIMSFLMVR